MRHLLDSHSLLWYALGDPQLSRTAKTSILDSDNEILISPASYWEIAIKVSLGKLKLHQSYEQFIDVCLNQYGFTILSVDPRHTARLIGLPFHHNNPRAEQASDAPRLALGCGHRFWQSPWRKLPACDSQAGCLSY